jgi:lipoyl-dependent peroxiredoxin subunit D
VPERGPRIRIPPGPTTGLSDMKEPQADKVDFELWSLVVSAVNGCGMCLEAHEKVLREHGLSAEQIQAAVRIAATVHAVARTLSAEEALAVPLAKAA